MYVFIKYLQTFQHESKYYSLGVGQSYHEACGICFPTPGLEPRAKLVKAQNLATGWPGDSIY